MAVVGKALCMSQAQENRKWIFYIFAVSVDKSWIEVCFFSEICDW
jgi:hypothetical protein